MSGSGAQAWLCLVCGYVHHGPNPPDVCPVCGAASSNFEPHEDAPPKPAAASTRWQCLNCSYIHDGPEAPDVCPVCAAAKDRFEPVGSDESDAGATDFDGHLVIVGSGIAGLSAVEAFRDTTSGGTVTLVARESVLPYYRLNLTRLLAGEIGAGELAIRDDSWFSDRNVDVKLDSEASAIDVDGKTVKLRDGSLLPFDKLVMTAGAHPFIPAFPGSQREGVTSLRTVRDAERMISLLHDGMKCVVIGGGLLGLEVAGALAARKADVTLLEGHDWLMPRQLNRAAGEILLGHVESLGVKVRRNARTKELAGDERVASVELEDGTSVPADLVVIATGVRPNSHLARRIGLDVNKGVVVDNHLRSSHVDVFAAGDVAEHHGNLYGSWAASQFQGRIAGMNAAGAGAEFGGIPRSHTLKVLGCDMLSIGRVEPEDGSYRAMEARRGDDYYRFVFHDGRLAGAVLVGSTAISGAIKKAVEEKTDFSGALLAGTTADGFVDQLGGS